MSFFSSLGGIFTAIPAALKAQSGGASSPASDPTALPNIRKVFPGPTACATGAEKLAVYLGNGKWDYTTPCGSTCAYIQKAVTDMQRTVTDWHQPRGETSYIQGYGVVAGEYMDYYNQHCVPAGSPPATAPASANLGGDPVLNSALVSPAGAVITPPPATAAVVPAPAPAAQLINGVPNWALYAGGGVIVLIIVIAIAKK